MSAKLPDITVYLIAIGTTARSLRVRWRRHAIRFRPHYALHVVVKGPRPRKGEDRPGEDYQSLVFGDIWIKYQVAQFSRVLGTLLTGGIPLMQGLETAAESLGTPLLRKTLDKADPHA